jgi:transcriptional regulator with XRE-family HTH domain
VVDSAATPNLAHTWGELLTMENKRQNFGTVEAKGNLLRLTRLSRGLAVDQLAYAAGVDRKTVAKAESGKPIYLHSLVRLAEALEMSVEALLETDESLREELRAPGFFRVTVTIDIPYKRFADLDTVKDWFDRFCKWMGPEAQIRPVRIDVGSTLFIFGMDLPTIHALFDAYTASPPQELQIVGLAVGKRDRLCLAEPPMCTSSGWDRDIANALSLEPNEILILRTIVRSGSTRSAETVFDSPSALRKTVRSLCKKMGAKSAEEVREKFRTFDVFKPRSSSHRKSVQKNPLKAPPPAQ